MFNQLYLKTSAEQIIAKTLEVKHMIQEIDNQIRYCFRQTVMGE